MNRSSTDPRWRGLFLAGAVGAALTAACIPLQVLLFIAWPPPASREVADWFRLFNENPVRGLLSMDLVMMVEQVLLVPVVISLWVLLRRRNASLMTLGATLWLAGGFLFIGSNTAFEMLSLARGYAAATTEAARAGYLAAGQGMLASYLDMGTGFVLGYVISSVGGLLAGVAMLRTAGWHAAGRVLLAGSCWGCASSCRSSASPSRSCRYSCSLPGTRSWLSASAGWPPRVVTPRPMRPGRPPPSRPRPDPAPTTPRRQHRGSPDHPGGPAGRPPPPRPRPWRRDRCPGVDRRPAGRADRRLARREVVARAALPADTANAVACTFWALALAGFVAAGLALAGVAVPVDALRPLALVSAIVSLAGIGLFLGTWPTFNTLAAIAVNVAVLVALLR